jgi:hypothetical protein
MPADLPQCVFCAQCRRTPWLLHPLPTACETARDPTRPARLNPVSIAPWRCRGKDRTKSVVMLSDQACNGACNGAGNGACNGVCTQRSSGRPRLLFITLHGIGTDRNDRSDIAIGRPASLFQAGRHRFVECGLFAAKRRACRCAHPPALTFRLRRGILSRSMRRRCSWTQRGLLSKVALAVKIASSIVIRWISFLPQRRRRERPRRWVPPRGIAHGFPDLPGLSAY